MSPKDIDATAKGATVGFVIAALLIVIGGVAIDNGAVATGAALGVVGLGLAALIIWALWAVTR